MLISIITINYNDAVGLERTITSVQEQDFKDVEHIIIDGNSYDGSKSIIEKYKDHFSYSISEPDGGVYHAMNKGIAVAKGDYLLFLNSGDVFFENNSLQKFKPYLKENTDIIYGDILIVSNPSWVKTYPNVLSFGYLLNDSLPHPATLIKRTCLETFPYDETLKIVSDWKFYLIGICKNRFSYYHVNEVISEFNLDGISSNNPTLVSEERRKVINEEFELFIEDYKELNELRVKQNKLSLNKKFKKLIKKITP